MTTPFIPQQQPYPQPMYPAQPPQYQQPPQQQPYVPQPTQQPNFAPPPAYPQAPQAPQGVDLNARLQGPGIPPELQGRTVGEGLRYYGIMREDFRQRQEAMRQQQPLQGQAPQPQQQPQQPGFPSAQPRGTAPQGAPADPMHQYIADAIREVMPEYINPIVQPMQQQNLERTYNGVKARYPDWQQYEAEIIQSLQGADMNTLNNPAAWDAAYKYAVGNRLVGQRQQPQPQYQQPQNGGPPMPPQGYPQQQPPQYQPQGGPPQGYPYQAPQQPLSQTFVEGPTPPAPQYGPNGQGTDPRDEVFAARFNVPVEVYRSWKGGRVGMLPRPGQIPQQDVWGNQAPAPQQGGPPGYPPQGYVPQGQYTPPPPPGFYQPPVNGASYGR